MNILKSFVNGYKKASLTIKYVFVVTSALTLGLFSLFMFANDLWIWGVVVLLLSLIDIYESRLAFSYKNIPLFDLLFKNVRDTFQETFILIGIGIGSNISLTWIILFIIGVQGVLLRVIEMSVNIVLGQIKPDFDINYYGPITRTETLLMIGCSTILVQFYGARVIYQYNLLTITFIFLAFLQFITLITRLYVVQKVVKEKITEDKDTEENLGPVQI